MNDEVLKAPVATQKAVKSHSATHNFSADQKEPILEMILSEMYGLKNDNQMLLTEIRMLKCELERMKNDEIKN